MDDTFRRGPLLLLSGRANFPLAEEIGERLGSSMDTATIRRFADGELFVRIDKNARGRDVIIVQPTNAPAENMMELLLLIDAAKRASAARVTAVVPYFGYGRQDRKDQPRVAIGAKLPSPAARSTSCSSTRLTGRRCRWLRPCSGRACTGSSTGCTGSWTVRPSGCACSFCYP